MFRCWARDDNVTKSAMWCGCMSCDKREWGNMSVTWKAASMDRKIFVSETMFDKSVATFNNQLLPIIFH